MIIKGVFPVKMTFPRRGWVVVKGVLSVMRILPRSVGHEGYGIFKKVN